MSQRNVPTETVERAVIGYVAAWNEDDPRRLRELIAACWAEDGEIYSNFEYLKGHDALFQRIHSWRQGTPAHRGVLATNIEHHHCFFRFRAVILRPDRSEHSQALDIGELGDDGRIRRIITFHLEEGSPPDHWPGEIALRK